VDLDVPLFKRPRNISIKNCGQSTKKGAKKLFRPIDSNKLGETFSLRRYSKNLYYLKNLIIQRKKKVS